MNADAGMQDLGLELPRSRVRIGLAAARFNQFITSELLEGALDALGRAGVSGEQITLAWVPGAFELPLAAQRLLACGCDAVIALGAVIRGGTPHFDYVAGECARGLAQAGLDSGKPVIFGVLTTDTVEQAMERAATAEGNKGFDVAMAAMHMLGLWERLPLPTGGSEA